MVTGGIFGLGSEGYILAIISMQKTLKMKIDKKLIKELSEYLDEFKLTEIEFTEKDTKIKVSKNNISISNQATPVIQNTTSIKENNKNLDKSQPKKILLHQLLALLIILLNQVLKNLLKLEKKLKKVIQL